MSKASKNILGTLFFVLCHFARGFGDLILLGGAVSIGTGSDAPQYPVSRSLLSHESQTGTIAFPANLEGEIRKVAIDSFSGTVLYLGQDSNNLPLLYKGSVVSNQINPVPLPSGINAIEFVDAAFDSMGNAILIGNQDEISGIVYRLPLGANQLVPISFPDGDIGLLASVAVASNHVAYLAGQLGDMPVGYSLSPSATELVPLEFMGVTSGTFNVVKNGPNNSLLFGGQNSSTDPGEALIYRLASGSSTPDLITVPGSDDGGSIYDLTITPNGTAILIGTTDSGGLTPLIYSLPQNSSSATTISNPDGNFGQLVAAATYSDGTSILVGGDYTTMLPLIYSVAPDASTATSIAPPTTDQGLLVTIAIDSTDLATFAGGYFDLGQFLILSLPIGSTSPSLISSPSSYDTSLIRTIGTYEFSEGLYNINRLRPYYYSELYKNQAKLNQAGIP